MLKAWGFKYVTVLNGGLKAWGDRATEEGDCKGKDTKLILALNEKLVVSYEQVKEMESSDAQICDGRPAEMFGKGSVPKSHNVPDSMLLNGDNQLKSADELKLVFTSQGVDCNKPLVTMCATGMKGSLLFLAANEIGIPQVRLYDGSWTEYAAKQAEAGP